MSDEQKKFCDFLVKYPMRYCTPIAFTNPPNAEGKKINNGTCTLLDLNGVKIGVTNFHVIKEYRERKAIEKNLVLQIGNYVERDIEKRIISSSEDYDLITFTLNDLLIDQIKTFGNVPTEFFPINGGFERCLAQADDYVTFGGYPAKLRSNKVPDCLEFDTFSATAKVDTFHEDIVSTVIDLSKNALITSYRGKELPENLGGISGGPVFISKTDPIINLSTLRFLGFVFEDVSRERIRFRPVSLINTNGTIVDLPFGAVRSVDAVNIFQ